ncbi:hypothetical protein [Halalkalibacter alkalisediminis]|uniref:Uncharacterized protein n=1 Tax=Halalkalibacter alkalisediminis TaxID=935616 RepID=A0ABV6NQK8_9BACI|nr:hypothetical protein [Halalkalibacter alkalisediminis]
MKKLLSLGVASILIVSPFISSQSAFAADLNRKVTESYEINWDDAWKNVDSLNTIEHFGSSNDPNSIGIYSYGNLASGSTSLGISSQGVTSTGKTTGKIISTVTSATTSLRNSSQGYGGTGPKKTAIGKLTATSEYTMSVVRGNVFTGLTVHTATNSGVLYESGTSQSNVY